MSSFGEVMKSLRENVNMTQKQLADVLHVSTSAVSSYEQDLRSPSSEMLVSIANVFHVSVDYLLGREQGCRALYISDLTDRDFEILQMVIRFLREINDRMPLK